MKRPVLSCGGMGALALLAMLVLGAHTSPDNPASGIPTGPYELQYPVYFGNRILIPADNPLTRQGVYLGRLLFYEPKLSVTQTISCASCHQQSRAFTDGKTLSEGVGNLPTTRNSMSLSNLLWARSFFWDGRSKSLERQGREPIIHPREMGESFEGVARKLRQTEPYPALFQLVFGTSEITEERIVKALAQFERSLISANAPYDQYLRGEYQPSEAALRGLALFETAPNPQKGIRGANCGHCHGTPKLFQ